MKKRFGNSGKEKFPFNMKEPGSGRDNHLLEPVGVRGGKY